MFSNSPLKLGKKKRFKIFLDVCICGPLSHIIVFFALEECIDGTME